MVAEWRDFTVVTKLIKNFKSLYGFGGRCFNIRDVCMDFEPCFKVYNLVSIRPKSMQLGQMTNLNMIFHMVGSVYRLVTIRNSPQFPVEFRNGLWREWRCRPTWPPYSSKYQVLVYSVRLWYLTSSITWPYGGLKFIVHWGRVFFKVHCWPSTGFRLDCRLMSG